MEFDIKKRIEAIRERIDRACEKVGRKDQVKLLGATKGVPIEKIKMAKEAGLTLFGENYVKEAKEKIPKIKGATFHLIGHLQRNKVKDAVTLFDLIETVDSIKLADEIEKRAEKTGKKVKAFIEVNIGLEPQKSGVLPDELESLIEHISNCKNIELLGLMTIPPYTNDDKQTRLYFRKLRELRDRIDPRLSFLKELSMGMSEDFELAILEGSTIVRIGRAIFGERR